MNSRAQSESIGVILLVGIVVVTVATVGAFALTNIDSDQRDFDATVAVTTDSISIAHAGGDPVPFSELVVVVRVDGTTTRLTPNPSELTVGDGDDAFEPGERWVDDSVSYSMDDLVTVRLFDADTQLSKETLYPNRPVSTGTAAPTPTGTATPTGTPTATATDSTAPTVTVNAPDGGEVFAGGNTTTIEWTASDSGSGVSSVDVAYSTDNGSTWNTIVSGTTDDGVYDWTTPAVNSSEALVRVTATDNAGNSASDTSDATFTIDDAPPTVDSVNAESPNGTDTVEVNWSVSDNLGLGNLTVELRRNGNLVESKTPAVSGTNASGTTEFTNLQPGSYTVVVIVEDSATQSDSGTDTANVTAGGGGPPNGGAPVLGSNA